MLKTVQHVTNTWKYFTARPFLRIVLPITSFWTGYGLYLLRYHMIAKQKFKAELAEEIKQKK